MSQFDSYADNYDEALERGLSISGEGRDFYLHGRIAWLAQLGLRCERVLDFGCGTGNATPVLRDLLGARDVVGVDASAQSLTVARREHPDARFASLDEAPPPGDRDLVYTNGVFHHIPVAERAGAVGYIHDSLRPGGTVALWENNPWNPGTRYVMWKIPFDRDAIPLSAPSARRLLRDAGFELISTHFLFVFPRALRALRGLETYLARLPLGAQYLVLGQKRAGRTER